MRNENTRLKEKLAEVKARNVILTEENAALRKENQLMRDDNKRMKRILNKDSFNSSVTPSKSQPVKAPNTYNSRKPTEKKAGSQCSSTKNPAILVLMDTLFSPPAKPEVPGWLQKVAILVLMDTLFSPRS